MLKGLVHWYLTKNWWPTLITSSRDASASKNCGQAYFPKQLRPSIFSKLITLWKCTGHHYDATYHQRQWNKLQQDHDNENEGAASWHFAKGFAAKKFIPMRITLWQSGGGSIGSWESLLFETDDTLVLPPIADQASILNLYKDCDFYHFIWRSEREM